MQSNIENLILAALIESKDAYEEFTRYGNLDEFSPINRAIVQAVERYRQLDSNAGQVDRVLLEESLLRDIRNDKHVEPLKRALHDIPTDVSVQNVRSHLAEVHRQAVGQRLSLALANGSSNDEVAKLITDYQKGDGANGQFAGAASSASLVDCLDPSDLLTEKPNDNYIKLAPKSLNERLDGGALRGHHVLVYARPETGKTLFTINATVGFIKQGLSVCYVGNEEPAADIRDRIRGRLLKQGKQWVRANRGEAADRLRELSVGGISIIETTSFQAVRACLGSNEQPGARLCDVVIFDQVRNMRLKSDSRTAELEAAGIEARAIAKDFNVLVVSVTQAGDSASGKVYLDMSDIDSSKTGLIASADLAIGLGADEAMKVNGLMGVSLVKNKLSGLHDKFTVNVNFSTGEVN